MQDVPEDVVVASIPLRLAITDTANSDAPKRKKRKGKGPKRKEEPARDVVARKLVEEAEKGEASPWFHYIQVPSLLPPSPLLLPTSHPLDSPSLLDLSQLLMQEKAGIHITEHGRLPLSMILFRPTFVSLPVQDSSHASQILNISMNPVYLIGSGSGFRTA